MPSLEIDLTNLTVDKIEAFICDAREAKLALDLSIPANKHGYDIFLSEFRCTRCGKCCDGTIIGPRGEKFVRLNEADFKRLKQHMKAKKLRRLFIEIDNREHGLPLPCPFFIKKTKSACKIYDFRPDMCRLYPLQTQVLSNPIGPPTIKVDSYCEGACNLFRNLLIIRAKRYKEQIAKMNKNEDTG